MSFFRRWAEERIYKKTMQIAVSELRRAARTANPLEKLASLDIAEQKLKDAAWLRPDRVADEYRVGLQQIEQSRLKTLREQAGSAITRLLGTAERDGATKALVLEAAAHLLAFMYHYLPDEPEVESLGARFRELGGKQQAYRQIRPLSEFYHRVEDRSP
jgi:hypothetical protein